MFRVLKFLLSVTIYLSTPSLIIAEQWGVVGYLSFDQKSNQEWTIQISSGGAKALHEFNASSQFYNCLSWREEKPETQRIACLLRLTSNGFENVGDLEPRPEAPSKNLIEMTDAEMHALSLPFAAGAYEKDPSKLLVWMRGDSAQKLYEILKTLDPQNANDDLYQGPNLSCYKRQTTLLTKSGASLYRPYMSWCKFLVNKDGSLEAFKISGFVLDSMKRQAKKAQDRAQ